MSEEHTDNLKKARARLIEQRRAFVKVLAGPYERGKTEQARERFLDMQTAIEAMNRGANDYILKPLEWDELKVKIEKLYHLTLR